MPLSYSLQGSVFFFFLACGIIFCAYGFMFWSLAICFFQFFVGFDRDLGLDGLCTWVMKDRHRLIDSLDILGLICLVD